MASEQSTAASGPMLAETMTAEDVASPYLPAALRGYDRDEVDRHLGRVAAAYASLTRQNADMRARLERQESDLRAAYAEAEASAKAVSEMMKAPAPSIETDGDGTRLAELEAQLQQAELERDRLLRERDGLAVRLADERGRAERWDPADAATTPRSGLSEEEASRVLVAATLAADDIRAAARARALKTLLRARDLAALTHAEAERERAVAVELQQRREQIESEAGQLVVDARREAEQVSRETADARAAAERDAEAIRSAARAEAERVAAEAERRRSEAEASAHEILAAAHAQADRTASEVAEERRRMRSLLSGALASLEGREEGHDSGLVADLESRLTDDGAIVDR